MKLAGTIKLEIIKPIDGSWDDVGARMRALRGALGEALNLTMRDYQPQALEQIQQARNGERAETTWLNDARKRLQAHWTASLARRLRYEQVRYEREHKQWRAKPSSKRPREPRPPVVHSFLPAFDSITSESLGALATRFTGDHLKDLIGGRSSIPSWRSQQTFYSEGRKCRIEGRHDAAVLVFPLWGTGRKATALAVKPAGGHARETWNRMVRDYAQRDVIVAAERREREARSRAAKARKAGDEKAERKARQDQQAEQMRLQQMGAYKLGRVGISHDDKSGKWYALISWTRYMQPPAAGAERWASVHFGVNVALQALAEDGSAWKVDGGQIIAVRKRFDARRRSIQKSKRDFGSGARGHGEKRREKPLTELRGKESNWTETKVRQMAADFVRWCTRHGVTDVLVEDMSGIRDHFERKTKGQAHEELKRRIHGWHFYRQRTAIEYEAKEHGIRVHVIKPASSKRCPVCNHDSPDNVVQYEREAAVMIYRLPGEDEPRHWRSVEKAARFECGNCGTKALGDEVSCENALVDAGHPGALGKRQEKARKRAKVAIKRVVAKER